MIMEDKRAREDNFKCDIKVALHRERLCTANALPILRGEWKANVENSINMPGGVRSRRDWGMIAKTVGCTIVRGTLGEILRR